MPMSCAPAGMAAAISPSARRTISRKPEEILMLKNRNIHVSELKQRQTAKVSSFWQSLYCIGNPYFPVQTADSPWPHRKPGLLAQGLSRISTGQNRFPVETSDISMYGRLQQCNQRMAM